MGREVRMVPKDWEHPKDADGRFVPLLDGLRYRSKAEQWDKENAKWDTGWRPYWLKGKDLEESLTMSYAAWAGERPVASDYMPQWKAEERTHFMAYEATTEGTPISPAFATGKELAEWMTANGDPEKYNFWLNECALAQGTARRLTQCLVIDAAEGFRGVQPTGELTKPSPFDTFGQDARVRSFQSARIENTSVEIDGLQVPAFKTEDGWLHFHNLRIPPGKAVYVTDESGIKELLRLAEKGRAFGWSVRIVVGLSLLCWALFLWELFK